MRRLCGWKHRSNCLVLLKLLRSVFQRNHVDGNFRFRRAERGDQVTLTRTGRRRRRRSTFAAAPPSSLLDFLVFVRFHKLLRERCRRGSFVVLDFVVVVVVPLPINRRQRLFSQFRLSLDAIISGSSLLVTPTTTTTKTTTRQSSIIFRLQREEDVRVVRRSDGGPSALQIAKRGQR